MTGFLLTAKQKLMLCINKRLYRCYRPHRAYWSHRGNGRNRSHRTSRGIRYRCNWLNWRYRNR